MERAVDVSKAGFDRFHAAIIPKQSEHRRSEAAEARVEAGTAGLYRRRIVSKTLSAPFSLGLGPMPRSLLAGTRQEAGP
jgi:hypothetical protein